MPSWSGRVNIETMSFLGSNTEEPTKSCCPHYHELSRAGKWQSLSPDMVLQILSEVLSTPGNLGLPYSSLEHSTHKCESRHLLTPPIPHTHGSCHILNALRKRHCSNPTSEKCFSLWPREERGGGQASLGCWIKNIFRAWSFPTAWKQEVPNPREQ